MIVTEEGSRASANYTNRKCIMREVAEQREKELWGSRFGFVCGQRCHFSPSQSKGKVSRER